MGLDGNISSVSGRGRPPVLMAQVLMRGRFCEAIASAAKVSLGESDPFLLGMFSLLDAILQRPLPGILDDLNIGPRIRNALLGTAGESDPLTLLLHIVKCYEVADWQGVETAAGAVGLSADVLSTCYLESLTWVDTVFTPDEQKGPCVLTPVTLQPDREILRADSTPAA